MTSLDIEPPSKFVVGEKKEVNNKKKKGTSSSLIVLLKGNGNQIIYFKRNLEKEVKSNSQNNNLNFDYVKNDGYSVEENLTATHKSLEFTKTSTNSDQIISNFNYGEKNSNATPTTSSDQELLKFYNINLSYSFIPQIKEEYKKEDLSTKSAEPENKEVLYTLYLEEEKGQENQNGL